MTMHQVIVYLTDTEAPRPRRFASFGVADGPGRSVADVDEEELLAGLGSTSTDPRS